MEVNIKVADYQLRAQVAKALAHPTRLLILDALKNNEMCVSELTDLVGADQSTISKHIAVLRNAGLIEDHKRGVCRYYSLLCPCLQNFFDCLEQVVCKNMERYRSLCSSCKD